MCLIKAAKILHPYIITLPVIKFCRRFKLQVYQTKLMENLFMTLWIIICLVVAVIAIAGMWKTFEKAGRPGWAAIIPIYNSYKMIKIGGKPDWWIVLLLIPIVNIIFGVWIMNMVSKSFGKDEGFTIGLLFLGFIFWPILGFGDAVYQGPFGNPEAYRAYQEQLHRRDDGSLL
jgi:hypothetical protein